jgi:hypothetical protein
MKRSEMIELIAMIIDPNLSDEHWFRGCEIAEHILDKMEAAGMVPPCIDCDGDYRCYCELSNGEHNYGWEPEA